MIVLVLVLHALLYMHVNYMCYFKVFFLTINIQ